MGPPKQKQKKGRSGPQIGDQVGPDTSIIGDKSTKPRRGSMEPNRFGVPPIAALPGKTQTGGTRHHCPRKSSSHKNDKDCLQGGCANICADCGEIKSRFGKADCRKCLKQDIKHAREMKNASGLAKMVFAHRPHWGVRKRTGRVGERASRRPPRRPQHVRSWREGGSRLSDDEVTDSGDEMDECVDEWEDVEPRDADYADEDAQRQGMEEDAALQRRIRESLIRLMS